MLGFGACAGDHDPPRRKWLTHSLVLTAQEQGLRVAPTIAGRLIHFTEEYEAVALDTEETDVERSATIRVGPVADGSSLRFSYFAPPPILRAGPVEIAVEFLDAAGAEQRRASFTVKRNRVREILNRIRESWQVDYEYIDFYRHFDVPIDAPPETPLSIRFRVRAEPEDQTHRDEYEKRAGTPMPSPFLIADPRLVAPPPDNPPRAFNVLVVIVDALRADAVGAYGYGRRTTPNIDALAAEGLLVERAYAPSNFTRGSVTALYTGRYASTLGIPLARWDLSGTEKAAFRRLTTSGEPADLFMDSLPRRLARRGYVTAHIGSNPFIQEGTDIGAALGFSRTASFNLRRFDTEAIASQSLEFIRRNALRPFFLAIHFNNGHGPLQPPARYAEKFTEEITNDPRVWPQPYDAEIAYADEKIGALVRALDHLGLADRTLVIVCADHGEGFEPGHPKGHAHSLYEGEVRVPLILRLSGRLPAGVRIPGPATLLDVVPTVGALIGEDTANGLDGENLLAHVGAPDDTPANPVYLEGAGVWAISDGEDKLIVKEGPYERMNGRHPADGGRFLEYYDLAKEPRERANMAGTHPPFETHLADMLYEKRLQLARYRQSQLDALAATVENVEHLYPHRFAETVNVMFAAGEHDRHFFGTVRCAESLLSLLGADLEPDDELYPWESRIGLSYSIAVPAGETRRFGFTPWPPDAEFVMTFQDQTGSLPANHVYAGPYTLAYPGNPARLGGKRDVKLLASPSPPPVDAEVDFGAFIWYTPASTKAGTAMGGQVKDALKAWGYVK
ncbi:MAG: sulfatase [Deltaproteobacteria bacterium]|nr:sulfatase [Deltaproteobacteria bacterium]